MNCTRVSREGIIESYLSPRALSPQDESAFEEHYFGCASCFEQLQAARAARAALVASPRASSEVIAMPARKRVALRWVLAAAATIFVVVGLGFYSSGSLHIPRPPVIETAGRPAPAARDLTQLARYEAPAFDGTALRGATDSAEAPFRQAMFTYGREDYGATAARLKKVLEEHSSYTPALFYHGACELLQSHADVAIAEMNAVLQDGQTPFLDEARWALAKAWLLKGDAGQAREQLSRLAAGDGDLSAQAKGLLARFGAS